MIALSCPKTTIPVFILFLLVWASPALSLELLGNWTYRESGGDNLETQSTFQQRYQLGVGPALTFQPTPAITISGGVGYRNTQRDGGDGRTTVEQVSPFADFTLINDVFVASLSATSYTTMAGSDTSTSYWNGTLNSAWDIPLWPTVQFAYGEDFAGVDKATLFDDSAGKSKSTTIGVNWDLLLGTLYYEYNNIDNISNLSGAQSETTTHYVIGETDGRFWSDRIGYNFSQQYRQTETEASGGDLAVDDDSIFANVRVEGQTSFTTTLAPPDQCDPTNNPQLNDGIFNAEAAGLANNAVGCFGFTPAATGQIDTLYLSLDSSQPQLTAGQAAALQWVLFVRRPFPVGLSIWELVPPGGIPVDFNIDEQRFELRVDINASDIMVSTTNLSGSPLSFSELEGIRSLIPGSGYKRTDYKTEAGLRFAITRSLGAFFSFGYEHAEDENLGEVIFENDKTNWSGRLQWSPVPYITPALGYSEYREERTGVADDLNRLYSATISSNPLPSLNVSLGYTHNDRYADNTKTYSGDNYSIFSKFSVYPDLSVSMSNSLSVTDTLIGNDGPGEEGVFVNNKSINSRLDISANLYRHLTAYAYAEHNKSDNEINGKNETARGTMTLNYRPSNLLALQSSYVAYFLDDERTNALSASVEVYLLRTRKTRLSVYVNHTRADESFTNVRGIGNWDISDHLTLTTSGNYNIAPEANIYSFTVSLSARL